MVIFEGFLHDLVDFNVIDVKILPTENVVGLVFYKAKGCPAEASSHVMGMHLLLLLLHDRLNFLKILGLLVLEDDKRQDQLRYPSEN